MLDCVQEKRSHSWSGRMARMHIKDMAPNGKFTVSAPIFVQAKSMGLAASFTQIIRLKINSQKLGLISEESN
jgi:hypothetical protein